MISHREWIEKALSHQEPEAVPYNFSFTPPARRLAEEHYGKDLAQELSLPLRTTGLKSVKPLYADPAEHGKEIRDEFGVLWATSLVDRGAPIGPCLREPSLSGYAFPDAKSEHRYENLAAWCSDQDGHYRIIWIGDLWERATFMRGTEHILLDVALNPGFVEALLRGIADHILQSMTVLFERFEFEAVALSDDYGTQNGLLISPDDWRKLIKPFLAEIYAFAKENGRVVFHHSCGNIVPIIGDMIDIGLDILHPIQPEAMDILYLKKEFGSRLTFCGGIPTQDLLVFGSPEQIREEVRRLKRDMGAGGGYILEPGITLQADVPVENIVAVIDEARSGLQR